MVLSCFRRTTPGAGDRGVALSGRPAGVETLLVFRDAVRPGPVDEAAKVDVAFLRGFEAAALNRQNDVVIRFGQRGDDAFPIDDALTARATEHSANLAAQALGVLDTDVFRVHVCNLPDDLLKPFVRVVFAEVAVSGVEVDRQGWAVNQIHDLLEALRSGGVGAVGFDRDLDAAGFRHQYR